MTNGMLATTQLNALPDPIVPSLPGNLFAYGRSFGKRAIMRRFFADSNIQFIGNAEPLLAGSALLLCGSQNIPQNIPDRIKLIRLEDGVLRVLLICVHELWQVV